MNAHLSCTLRSAIAAFAVCVLACTCSAGPEKDKIGFPVAQTNVMLPNNNVSCTAQAFYTEDEVGIGMSDGTVALYSISRKKWIPVLRHAGSESVDAISFSPDGHFMATGGKSGVVAITDMQSHAVLHKLTIGAPITCLEFSYNSTMLAAGTQITSDEVPKGSKVVVWNVPAYKELTELPADDDVGTVCFSRSPVRILVGDRHATVYALPSAKKIWTQAIGYSPGAAISPNGAVVLCGNGFFNVNTNRPINAKYNQYTFAAFSRQGDIVVGGGEEDGYTLYDATTCKPISDLDMGSDNSYALSPLGNHMASGNSDDATMTIYNINVALLRKSGYFTP